MAKVLGLDLGTNSIGWAVIDNDLKRIEAAGSRIIPMDAGLMGDFEKGNPISFTSDRTQIRGMRRLRERYLLRRERLLRVLGLMGFLPEHFASRLDRYGHLPLDCGARIAWRENKDGKQEFIFRNSFEEMVENFRQTGYNRPLPYDWTIYYLRHKAITEPISREELAWVLIQMNQKRGYNQLRGKDDEALAANADKEYHELKVISVEDTGELRKGGGTWYNITLENGWIYRRTCTTPPDWVGKTKAFIATFKLNKDGSRKNELPSLSAPTDDDWGLRKIKTEHDIKQSGLTLGQFIYQSLLNDPQQKIIGDRVQTVDRSLYRDELHHILESQARFHPELRDTNLYSRCVEALYPNNEAHRRNLAHRDFTYLIADDILLYQRPLKSKQSLIADCPYEQRGGKPVKCIAKSHPAYQEFRLWQFIANLRIYREDKDITTTLLPNDITYCDLYNFLATQKTIDQKGLLKHFFNKKADIDTCRWNYVTDRTYPMGETRATILGGLRKASIEDGWLNSERELQLWHIMYSVDNQQEYRQALRTFATKQGLDREHIQSFATAFDRLTIYKEKDYGAYSHKAISRLLPLMRRGKYWSADDIDPQTRQRIEHIITGEVDETLPLEIRTLFANISSINQCQGLNTWQACYLVYGRHSEAIEAQKWSSPADIDRWLISFRRNSLNNPIVEQVVLESMRVVRDVWQQVGNIDEVHIELGRELKKTAAERASLSKTIADGEATNQRIRLLLSELANPDSGVMDVRPQSPSQLELLKIYEDGVLRATEEMPEDIKDIHKRFTATKNQPTHSEVMRYKIWLDQKYISPYTGRAIPLSKLFTTAYEIEHIIPQSRWFDDSLSNKVICEAEVNRLKGRMLGHEFITHYHGQRVPLTLGGTVDVLSVEQYEQLIKRIFANNRAKLKRLMLDDIPDDFNSRQLNDSRYISRLMMHLLSNIVRSEDEEGNVEQSTTSKNVIACTGSITDRLKHEWGIGDVWNRIILPRFERMNQLTNSTLYTTSTASGHIIPSVPMELRQGFNKKRIDHRHHAMDAIVIACCTRDHVNLLNNESAKAEKQRYDLQHKLRQTETYTDAEGQKHIRFGTFLKPWATFTEDTYAILQGIIVSFKQNLRVINKTTNRYTTYKDGKKHTFTQTKGDSWAIRKPMHKETVFGEINLQLKKKVPLKKALTDVNSIVSRELKEKIKEKRRLGYSDKMIIEFLEKNKDVWSEAAYGKVEVYYMTADTNDRYFATRKTLADVMRDCTTPAAAEKAIDTITDSGIRSILLAHLAACGGNAADAISPDGLEQMNQNIQQLNGGKPHMPIKRVRVYEQANKFSIGKVGQKATKYVEAAKGTNLFFAIWLNAKGERGYATIPLNMVIDLQKQHEKRWQQHLAERLQTDGVMPENCELLYVLSPGDLVYVPSEGEQPSINHIDRNRIYKVVSCAGIQFMCIHHRVSVPIANKVEYTSSNKMERAITGEMIKEVCLPLKVDRLGNIINIG